MRFNSLNIYIAAFLVVTLVLKLLGILQIGYLEILSYLMIICSMVMLIYSLQNKRPGILFGGTFIFLSGVLLFLASRFEFISISRLITSAVLMISGTGILMIYFFINRNKFHLASSLLLLTGGLTLTLLGSAISFNDFIKTLAEIGKKYWPVIIISLVVVVLLLRERSDKN
ncbi:MAG: hypothetical protein HXY49_04240 [Ignavibacteriaceae bacterium]|nr:hypothetical protein [Ignavibacteriaceae bacterium]